MSPLEPEPGELEALREELNHFIRLSQIQTEQLMAYQKLQQRSHRMIQKLQDQLSAMQSMAPPPPSFRK